MHSHIVCGCLHARLSRHDRVYGPRSRRYLLFGSLQKNLVDFELENQSLESRLNWENCSVPLPLGRLNSLNTALYISSRNGFPLL